MDPYQFRKEFPMLEKNIVYFDNAATSLTPKRVIEKIAEIYSEYKANVGRGVHKLAENITRIYEEARKTVASFINADPPEIIFTYNITYSTNILTNSLKFEKGDKIVLTVIEHHSNLLPWIRLSRKLGLKIEYLDFDENYNIIFDEDKLEDAKLLAIHHVSNVLGNIVDLNEVSKLAKKYGFLTYVDAAQSVGHLKIDVRELDIDFLGFSGHKMFGPYGIGVLYINKKHHDSEILDPFPVGGGTIEDVELFDYSLRKIPYSFEGGTPNVSGAVGLAEACKIIEEIGYEKIRKHEEELVKRFLEILEKLNLDYYGPKDPSKKISLFSFNVKGMSPHVVAKYLDSKNIYLRSGHMCALPLMKRLGIYGCVRASLHYYNTLEELDIFENVMKEFLMKI